jgi:hypothetical protein
VLNMLTAAFHEAVDVGLPISLLQD